jgi:hypothetical protein
VVWLVDDICQVVMGSGCDDIGGILGAFGVVAIDILDGTNITVR